MNAPVSTEDVAMRRLRLHRALYEWKDYGGPIEDVLEAIGDYCVAVIKERAADRCGRKAWRLTRQKTGR